MRRRSGRGVWERRGRGDGGEKKALERGRGA